MSTLAAFAANMPRGAGFASLAPSTQTGFEDLFRCFVNVANSVSSNPPGTIGNTSAHPQDATYWIRRPSPEEARKASPRGGETTPEGGPRGTSQHELFKDATTLYVMVRTGPLLGTS